MKLQLVISALIGTLFLTACGSKLDESDKNFKTAINTYLETNNKFCLGDKIFRQYNVWPQEIDILNIENPKKGNYPASYIAQLNALISADLLSVDTAEVDAKNSWGQSLGKTKTVRRYDLTALGKKTYVKQSKTAVYTGDFCYANEAVDKIIKWDIPQSFMGEGQYTTVTYRSKVINIADWSKLEAIKIAFPNTSKVIAEAGKEEHQKSLKLTSIGWEVPVRNF